IGQFAESSRDTVFTTEYSVRTAMEAVYQLLDIERGVPEVIGSMYDIRELFKSTSYMRDKKPLPVPGFLTEHIEGTMLGRMLEEYGVL
ncbi:MAG: oleate hydratase, partial [Acidimicrobiales bacterium]